MSGDDRTNRWRAAGPTSCKPARRRVDRRLRDSARRGLTLVELLVVLVVLAAVATVILPSVGGFAEEAQEQTTRATLAGVGQAIVGPAGYAQAMQFATDTAGNPYGVFGGVPTGLPWPSASEITGGRLDRPQLHYLFRPPLDARPYDPIARVGWNGPWLDATVATTYLSGPGFTSEYGVDGDLAPQDGWLRPIVIQLPAGGVEFSRLVSAGPDGVLDTPPVVDLPTLAEKNDDLVLYLYREDPFLPPPEPNP